MTSVVEEPSAAYLAEYDGTRLIVLCVCLIVVDTVHVGLRFWARRLRSSKLAWDDYLIIPSLVFCIGLCIAGILAVTLGGNGRHMQYVNQFPEMIGRYHQICFVAIPCLYMMAATFPKLAILATYLEIFIDTPSRIICWITGFVLVANCFANLIIILTECHLLTYLFNPITPGIWCKSIEPHSKYSSLPNIITDVVMLLLPIPLIIRLHTNRATKLALMGTFAMGSMGLITSCLRFAEFFSNSLRIDPTWAAIELMIYTLLECNMYLTAACFMSYRPLMVHLWEKLSSNSKRRDLFQTGHQASEISLSQKPIHDPSKSRHSQIEDEETAWLEDDTSAKTKVSIESYRTKDSNKEVDICSVNMLSTSPEVNEETHLAHIV